MVDHSGIHGEVTSLSSFNIHTEPYLTSYNLKIYFQNARDLRTKTNEIFTSVSVSMLNIIGLAETWLSSDILSSALFPDNFSICRCDKIFPLLSFVVVVFYWLVIELLVSCL